MKNERIEKLVSYFAKHYVNRYWVLLIDTLTSAVSTVLVLGVFDYFSSKDISLGYYLSIAGVAAFISLISFLVTKSYAGVVRHTTMREMWREYSMSPHFSYSYRIRKGQASAATGYCFLQSWI